MIERKEIIKFFALVGTSLGTFFHPVEARAQNVEYFTACMGSQPMLFVTSVQVPKDMRVAIIVRGITVDSRVGYAYSDRLQSGKFSLIQTAPLINSERYHLELRIVEAYDPITDRAIVGNSVFLKEIKAECLPPPKVLAA